MKKCFVVSPIGREGTKIRRNADLTLRHVISPACESLGFEAVRADQISDPGIITSQIISNIIDADIVVADLTGHNPNVFYELAIRHTLRRPVVQLMAHGETIPFDVAHNRTIFVKLSDPDSVVEAREELIRQMKSADERPEQIDTPVSVAVDWDSLRRSDNPLEKSHYEILAQIRDLKTYVAKLASQKRVTAPRRPSKRPTREDAINVDYGHLDEMGVVSYAKRFQTFQHLLDHCFFDIMDKYVPGMTYGRTWIFRHTGTGELIEKQAERDTRTLSEVGINEGDLLQVEFLGGRPADQEM